LFLAKTHYIPPRKTHASFGTMTKLKNNNNKKIADGVEMQNRQIDT
jgi:hypothetical protein